MQKLKNIRFNLRFFNGSDEPESVHSVKELEEKLRNNQIAFDDFMAYFFSGQLERWLECHGEKDLVLLDKLHAIDKKSTNKEIVKMLFAALGFCFDEQEIDRMIVSYDFPSRLKTEAVKNAKEAELRLNTLQDNINAYEALCRQLFEKNNDIVYVKKQVRKIIEKYYPLLELDAARFFNAMKNPNNGCPTAILELLMSPRGRCLFKIDNYPIAVKPIAEVARLSYGDALKELFGAQFDAKRDGNTAATSSCVDHPCVENGKDSTYKKSCVSLRNWIAFERKSSGFYVKIDGVYMQDSRPIEIIDDYSDAVGDWKVLVPKGRKIMVLHNAGVRVRSGKGDEWGEGEMNNRFFILDGCSYKQVFRTTAYLAYVEL